MNKPKHDMMNTPETKLAGEKFTNNQQCELAVGPGSKICSYMPVCSRLWCTQPDVSEREGGCATQHMPWADGTECGDRRWCQKGECVPRNRDALIATDGGWGEWQSFGECTRTCGGGIQYSTRECESPKPANGGKYCAGSRIRQRSCNTQDCPIDEPDFRQQQCTEFDKEDQGIPGIHRSTKWIATHIVHKNEECKLYCRAHYTSSYFEFKPKVIDGTPCSDEGFDKCVNGRCEPAGCDNVLGSGAVLDRCGICQGQNVTCYDVHKTIRYDRDTVKGQSRYPVARIPKGAANIEIKRIGNASDRQYICKLIQKNYSLQYF